MPVIETVLELNVALCLRVRPEQANLVWSYDFVSVMTNEERALRMLTLIAK